MLKISIVVFILLLASNGISAQNTPIVNMGGSRNTLVFDEKYNASNYEIRRKRVNLLTIGIGDFHDKSFSPLESYTQLSQFKKVSEDYLRLSYCEHPKPAFLSKNVTSEDVNRALEYLGSTVGGDDVVIISILSHAEIFQDEYYLVCTDTNSDDYPGTAVSGTEIRSYLEKMADNGAVVIVFVDTCNASALFDKSEFQPRNNGSIIYYASSTRGQTAKEINKECNFTKTILSIFLNQDKDVFNEYGLATIGNIQEEIAHKLKMITEDNRQNPETKIFTRSYFLRDFPVIKEKKPIPYGSILQHPKPFSPLAVSPGNERNLDYALIGIEGLSIAGMIVTGPILQSYYKHQIDKETNVFARNDFRQKGKNSALGFCVSTGAFITSYAFRTLHVHNQMKIEHKESQYATLNVSPVSSPDYNGFALVLNF